MSEFIADIEDDHLRLIALARLAISLESGPEWMNNPERACEDYGSACDALWREMRRQVDAEDGQIPVLKHPAVEARELAGRMRSQLRCAVTAAVEEAVENFQFEM